MGDRVAVLSRGVLQQVDSPQRLYDHPDNLFVAAFIGSPQMNLLQATLQHNGDGTSLRIGGHTLHVPPSVLSGRPSLASYHARALVVGIRPEHLRAASDGAPDTITGRVDIREGLGSEVIVHVNCDVSAVDTTAAENPGAATDHVITARLEPHTPLQAGDIAVLAVDVNQMHFFDIESGLALS
jgi:multiple sugar transport system ATP-binding protein